MHNKEQEETVSDVQIKLMELEIEKKENEIKILRLNINHIRNSDES